MKSWKIVEPEGKSAWNAELIKIIENGESDARYSLPSVDCSRCTTWGCLRLCNYEISEHIDRKFSLQEMQSLDPLSFAQLQEKLRSAFQREGYAIDPCEFTPGLIFPPLLLDIPEPPTCDILWRGAFLLISEKARSVISQFNDGSFFFCRAEYRRVGKWFPKTISQRDAEGIIDVEDALEYVTEFYPSNTPLNYYGLGITARIFPTDFTPDEVCEECGRFTWRHEPKIQNPHIFYIGDTLWVGVSNQLKEALEDEGITNLSFSAIVD